MKNYPTRWDLKSLLKCTAENSTEIDGEWVPARTLGFPSLRNRIRCAWLVFTGKADALVWPRGQ